MTEIGPPGGAVAAAPPGRIATTVRGHLGGLPREYWFLWTGTLVNRVGTFVQPFLALYLTGERGLSPSAAGWVLSTVGAGAVVSHLLGGVLADRVGRRTTMAIGMTSFAVCLSLLGLARGLPFIVAAAALTGLAGDLYRPASSALIADLVAPEDRPRAYGLQFWAVNLGFAISTVVAGLLASVSYGLLFAGDAATSLVFGLLVLRGVRETRPVRDATAEPGSLRDVLRDRLLLALVVLWLAYTIVYYQSYTTLPLAMQRDGLGAREYGFTFAFNGLAIVLIQPFAVGWIRRVPRVPMLAASMLLVGTGFGLTAFADETWQYVLTVLVWTLGEIGAATTGFAVIADIAPPHLRGRYSGVFGFAFAGAAVLAPPIGTAVLEHAGPGAVWAGCAALGVLTATGQLALGPAVNRRADRIAAATT